MNAFTFYDLHRIPYADALERQTSAFNALLENKREGKPGENCLFFCEHEPVFTIGKSGKDSNLLIPESLLAERGISLYHIARGGDITYHGPGQITGYPVFDLERWHLGLKAYIARLEEAIIRFLRLYDIKGERLDGATGVWLDPLVAGRARDRRMARPARRRACAEDLRHRREEQPLCYDARLRAEYQYGFVLFFAHQSLRVYGQGRDVFGPRAGRRGGFRAVQGGIEADIRGIVRIGCFPGWEKGRRG